MNTNIRSKALILGAITIGQILCASQTASATTILQTVTEGAGVDWTAASWGGPPAAVAAAGINYETPSSAFNVRTPNKNLAGLYSTNFLGSSLQIDSGGIFYLKHGGNLTNSTGVNLILNGGTMTYHGGFAPVPAPLSGTIQVTASSIINSDQTGSASADIWLLSPLSGSGNLSVNMDSTTNGLLLFGTNSAFTGNWTNTSSLNFIQIMSGSSNALGSGSLTLNFASDMLIYNATNSMVVSNRIFGPGMVIKQNTNTLTLSGVNTFTGPVQINAGILALGSSGAISNSSLISLNGATLDASAIGGLVLNPAGQGLNCNGTLIGDLTTSTLDTNNFTLTASTNNILNITGSLILNGTPTLNLLLSGYKASGIYRLINYTGTLQGGGSFNLVPPAGSIETFQLDMSTPGQVNLIVTGTTLNLTWVGDGSANNWDTTTPNWTGGSNTYAAVGDSVLFDDTGSSSPEVYVIANVTPISMTVNNTLEHYVFDGLGILTSGSLTKLGTNEVDFLANGNNFSGPVTISAGIVSLGAGGSTGILGTGIITNNGILQVNKSSAGVAFAAPIYGTGSINITGGGASVLISGTNSFSGGTTIGSGCQLGISSAAALGTGSAKVSTGGRVGVTSLVGTMAVANPITVSGNYISPGGALYVNSSGNNITWSGPITIGTGNDGIVNQIRAVNSSVSMNFTGQVLATNELLECTSGNIVADNSTVISFNNTVSLGSGGSFLADGLSVVVLAGTNVWGGGTTVGYGSGSSYISSSTATLLVNGKLNGGPLEVANSATLGGRGTILDPVTVDGAVAPGNFNIGTLTVNNSVTFNSGGAALMNINRTNAPTSSLLSATTINCGGTLMVANIGSTNLSAGDTFHLFAGSMSGAFTVTNLPTLPSTNLYWDTSLLGSGTLKVASSSTTPNAPTITTPMLNGTNFTLQVGSSQVGFSYVLQATPTLIPTSWTNAQTQLGTGGTLNFNIPVSTNVAQMYFRIGVH